MLRGEALQYDIKQLLGLPQLPAWLQPDTDENEALAKHWHELRPFAASPDLDEAANHVRRQALAWAEAKTVPGSDLDLLPRLGYPAVDILWLREAIEAYYVALPRLLIVCGPSQYLAAADGATSATSATAAASGIGRDVTNGVSLVFQDMQRTLRLSVLPPELGLLGQLPTYLYHLWPSLRALLRDTKTQAEVAALFVVDAAPTAPVGQSLPLLLLIVTLIAVRLGINKADYFRQLGLGSQAAAETEHNRLQTALGRDPTPCHT